MIVLAEGNTIGIKERSMKSQSLELARGRVESINSVRQAVGGNDFTVFENHQIVEAMLCCALRLEAAQKLSRCVKMKQLGVAAFGEGIRPHRGVARIEANAQHRQKPELIGGYEVRNPAVAADLDNFPAIEAAQVKDVSLHVVRQALRYQIFLSSANGLARLRHHREITVNAFDQRREFLGRLQFQKGRLTRRIETSLERNAFLQERERLRGFVQMLFRRGQKI